MQSGIIKPIHINFEQSKVLKEKGFNQLVNHFYCQKGKLHPRILESGNEPMPFEPEDFNENFNTIVKYEVEGKYQNVFSAPEQWQIIEWLRVKHGILVKSDCDCYGEIWYAKLYVCSRLVWDNTDQRSSIVTANHFMVECVSQQESYSSAFDYILNNLI